MKNLSIEEKAQRYDEAIKKAKEWFNSEEPDSYTCIVESIFPELKESEDDNIRRWIINEIKIKHHNLDEDNADFVDKAIAWLEKQGQTFTKKDVDDAYLEGMCVAKHELEKQGGQKPVLSEENKEMFGYLEDIVNFCYRNQFVVNVQTCEKVRQLVFRLKSLCFQSGWGKDDITRINEIIETLNIVQANRVRTQKMHYNKATIDKNIDWLKSLKGRVQPQNTWKPSDEQMEALLKLEQMHVLEHEKTQENAHLYMVVKSIREQLLKLREK